jgi:hypothetical protein
MIRRLVRSLMVAIDLALFFFLCLGLPSELGLFTVNEFPEVSDQLRYYNVSQRRLLNGQICPEEDVSRSIRSVPDVPLLTWSEFAEARAATERCLQNHGRLPTWSGEEAKTFYQFCVGDELVDRTLRVELPEARVLNATLIGRFQQEVLAKRPLWRIMIIGETLATTIMVYPNGVWFEGVSRLDNWCTELPGLVKRLLAITDKSEGPKRRQLNYLRWKIQRDLKVFTGKPFDIVSTFDNYCGNSARWSMWVICPSEESWFEIRVTEPDNVASSVTFAVRSDGFFGPEFDAEHPAYWLSEWVLPAGYRSTLSVEKIRVKRVIEKRWTIALDPSSIVRDVDLKRLEKGSLHSL